jgi:hypothetical protein
MQSSAHYDKSCNLYAMNTLAERLLEAINATGLEPEPLRKAIGVSKQSVYAWKRGEGIHQMKASNLIALSELSGLDPVWIIRGKGQKIREEVMTEEEMTLLRLYRECDERGKQAVLRTAEQERQFAKYSGDDRRRNVGFPYSGKDRRNDH